MKKKPLIIIMLAVLIVLLVVGVLLSPRIIRFVKNQLHSNVAANGKTVVYTTPQPGATGSLISYKASAFAASNNASDANDDSYDTPWRSNGAPTWLAYDLSGVPAAKRSKVLVIWYNDTGNYDHTLINYPAYNLPQDYTIDVNAATGGSNPPTTGWVTLETVKGNHYHSRQHVITMAGYNWLRINVTAIDGSAENMDASLNMNVYDANTALANDWIFYGDSITAGSMGPQSLNGVVSFAQQINARIPNNYPVEESGGIGYLTSAEGAKYLNTWLGLFPGKYVGLSYGTNDALGCVDPDTFYSNYSSMVQDVLDAGKVPLVPHIPWGRNANIQKCAPSLNEQIDKLYRAFPQIIHGPDLWSFFQSHQSLISNDDIHPSDSGFAALRQQWANTMLTEVYKK